jgi:hypothetical protein
MQMFLKSVETIPVVGEYTIYWYDSGNSEHSFYMNEEIVRTITKVVDTSSEPGLISGQTALKRAPWFKGVNPCAEIILPNKGFCNLCEVDIGKFRGDTVGLHQALYLTARANYRQTCVNLKDEVLQEAWHLNNEFFRLCGIGLTGIARREDLSEYDYRSMERHTVTAAYSMADELGLQRPKAVTTGKPSGENYAPMHQKCA